MFEFISLHVFSYSLPQFIDSDLGSQTLAASEIITSFLNDYATQKISDNMVSSQFSFNNVSKVVANWTPVLKLK